MGAYPSKLIWFGLLIFLVGCKEKHFRPVSVPSSALRVDNTFIDCSVDIRSRANNCTVYKDDTGQILAEGLFVLGTSDKGVDKSDLRFAAFGEQGIYLENLGVLQQQTASERDPSHRVFDERLKAIASKNLSNALDCGEWAVTNEADTVSECALAAFTHRKPFYVRYYEPERAHFRYDGIACDSDGNFYGGVLFKWANGAGRRSRERWANARPTLSEARKSDQNPDGDIDMLPRINKWKTSKLNLLIHAFPACHLLPDETIHSN